MTGIGRNGGTIYGYTGIIGKLVVFGIVLLIVMNVI